MARRGLKNVVREQEVRNGLAIWKLTTLLGDPVPSFDYFCEKNSRYSFQTQKRYAEVVSRFIDYLFEAKVLGAPVRAGYLNSVIDAYPTLLRDGSQVTSSRVRSSGRDIWLAEVAEALDWPPLASKSFDNTTAAVNRFLRLSESLAEEALEKAASIGIDVKQDYIALIHAMDGTETISRHEVAVMKQQTMFGNVAKFAPRGIQRARGLRGPKRTSFSIGRSFDFPQESLSALIGSSENWRDKSLWLLLAATGIRISEALNLHLDDVDMELQKVYVFDPSGRRPNLEEYKRLRFKGREMADTFLIPELQQSVFVALQKYLCEEFVPCYKPGETAYLFQYLEERRRGRPLVDASHSTLVQSFKRAIRKANIALPNGAKSWGLHSLRHMYGVYMVNDYPVNPKLGQFGLSLADVQMMMGHQHIRTTEHYARSKQRRLESKLAASDKQIHGLTAEELKEISIFNVRFLEGEND